MKEKIIVKKYFALIFFNIKFQRIFKFFDPEKYGKIRENFESFKYVFRVKFRANYD